MYESRVWEIQGGSIYKEYEEFIYSVTAGKGKSKVSRISHNEAYPELIPGFCSMKQLGEPLIFSKYILYIIIL